MADLSKIDAGVRRAQRALRPQVVRIMHTLGVDWRDEEACFLGSCFPTRPVHPNTYAKPRSEPRRKSSARPRRSRWGFSATLISGVRRNRPYSGNPNGKHDPSRKRLPLIRDGHVPASNGVSGTIRLHDLDQQLVSGLQQSFGKIDVLEDRVGNPNDADLCL
jgi:hypothetical protein